MERKIFDDTLNNPMEKFATKNKIVAKRLQRKYSKKEQ